MLYIKNGMPELMMPRIKVDLNLPLNSCRVLKMARITIKPMAPSNTRKKAVGNAPNTGAATRMNRKLAPQMAARTISRT